MSDETDTFEILAAQALADHRRALEAFSTTTLSALRVAVEQCAHRLSRGGKMLLFGNGGSAADAQHVAAELVNRFELDRRGLAAIALTADASIVTSVANDERFERVFARQIEALGRPGDVAIGISTSGRSANVVAGLEAAREIGAFAIALTGPDGGEAATVADLSVTVPGASTARVQEMHLIAEHLLCAGIEHRLADA